MKKFLSFAFVILMGITLAVGCKDRETSLDDVNAFLNDKKTMNMNFANTVAIIPFNHINGPRNEWKFYALVNFQYKTRFYVKYQVTYLSCTCRTADVNYWQTAYIELSLPTSGNPEDAVLRSISFDKDAMDNADGTNDGHYVAGFWGDSSPIWDEATGSKIIATYEKTIRVKSLYKITVDKPLDLSSKIPDGLKINYWDSSDTRVASVDDDGVVTGKRVGTTTIIAVTSGGAKLSWEVEVGFSWWQILLIFTGIGAIMLPFWVVP